MIDENFAREIMQLFTMGLNQLNMDGSLKLDDNGDTVLAYTNDDIMSLSRAWTGFDLQSRRGNIEGSYNQIDPMKIIPEWRDKFPKSETTGGYIGDTYPLCSDFPSRSFLRIGATYRFLGDSNLPELMTDPVQFATSEIVERLVLNETSSLRSTLCNKDNLGDCNYMSSVTLDMNHNCTDIECDIETVRVVQVEENVYYEFVQPPCVNMMFYNDAVKISPRYSSGKVMCADPNLPVASEACCSFGDVSAIRNSKYSGERMSFAGAESRCQDISKDVCDFYVVNGDYWLNTGYFWTTDTCQLRIKVKKDGYITTVHYPSDFLDRLGYLSDENENYFRVHWERGRSFPLAENNCDGICEVLSDGTCLCNTRVINSAVFNRMPTSKDDVMEKLKIGAFHPQVFDSDVYTSSFDENTNITVHLIDNEFNSDTIFEVDDDKGRTFFLKNVKSSVYLRGLKGGSTGQSFRNTPQFMSFVPSETTLR